ncbi:hypothetical protein FGE12_22035 [Aggregicoccus sp. 17bor-14]|uniref:hypothetical protein n=1 Tax=Myxococcaceae TaxID=31 RepID=UPI00129CDAF2|nr:MULTISPECIES: hypothetical protein [Myxococcaceae]MBF5045098.1 hypothetical protein [Simulacricoccus sp. 17bor-14]MRI90840.1 hypothetical protein [Aggregicoccus sp. 17bor-14]
MNFKPPSRFDASQLPQKYRHPGHEVGKMTKVAGKRIGGALRAEQARQQKRKDSRGAGGGAGTRSGGRR